MNIITPLHQFEIRYSPILDFHNVIGNAIAPFTKLATKINVENENSHKQRIILHFEKDFYAISIYWDKLVIHTSGLKNLNTNNSIIENPFFDIFSKIKSLNSFGEILNVLYYSIKVLIIEDKFDKITEAFNKKYFSDTTNKLLPQIHDSGFILESRKDNAQITFSLGPYVGPEDLKKKNVVTVSNPHITNSLNEFGEIFDFKYYEETKSLSFKKYNEINTIEDSYINKIWKK